MGVRHRRGRGCLRGNDGGGVLQLMVVRDEVDGGEERKNVARFRAFGLLTNAWA